MFRWPAKLLRLPLRDWRDLLAAQTQLLRAQLLVWLRPTGALVAPAPKDGPAVLGATPIPGVARLATAVSRAARYGAIRPSCLVRAVALQRLLQSRGFPAGSLCVGVRRDNGRFVAHAWVEHEGAILADEEWYVREFSELARMGVRQTP